MLGGCNDSTVIIFNLCLVSTSLDSEGRLGVVMITSGYLDPTRLKLSYSTRVAGRYEVLVRRATYAFLDSISSDGISSILKAIGAEEQVSHFEWMGCEANSVRGK